MQLGWPNRRHKLKGGNNVAKKFLLSVFIVSVLALSSGCAVNRATATVSADSDLSKVKTFYVVQQPKDDRGIEKLISDNLTARGFLAKSGPDMGTPPAGVDAVVTYVDKWMWDITMYMLELTLTVRNPVNNFPMANANSYHTSLTRKAPPEMVDEALTNIFNEQAKKQGSTR
jgi:hypothetical protein